MKGSCCSKWWIEQEAVLLSMYAQSDQCDMITIYCDGKQETTANARKRKRIAGDSVTSASDHEEVKSLAE